MCKHMLYGVEYTFSYSLNILMLIDNKYFSIIKESQFTLKLSNTRLSILLLKDVVCETDGGNPNGPTVQVTMIISDLVRCVPFP